MAGQIPLPLEPEGRYARSDFVVGEANRQAVAFVDSFPGWPAHAAALFGPAGSGKSHLARAWAARAGAQTVDAVSLGGEALQRVAMSGALVVEDIDRAPLGQTAETALFALMERGIAMLLTGREPPALWPARLPDLASRFRALLAFPLWAPDDVLLEAIARKLFDDRQLAVPEAVVKQMVHALERSPFAVRDFVARADQAALAEKRPITAALIRELLAKDR